MLVDRSLLTRTLRGLVAAGLLASCAVGGCGLSTEGKGNTPPPVVKTPCEDTTDCIDANPCTVDSCAADGFCAQAPFGDGDPPQIDGDCKHVTCDGAKEISTDDPDDQDDANPCTDDVCQGGAAVHTPVATGTACTQGPLEGTCDGAGACVVACETDAQCNDANECTDDACDLANKTCVNTPLTRVLPNAPNAPGDCKLPACVDGRATDVADAADLPDDQKECTVDSCTGTNPTFTPKDAGTPCAAGQCNAAGDCAGCVSNDFCGADTACATPFCNMVSVCDPGYEQQGLVVENVSPTDCKKTVCDGLGGQQIVNDDTEIPNDGLDCTSQACVNGTATTTFMPDTTPCDDNGGKICSSGACVECINAAQCAPNQVCTATQCCDTCVSLGKTCGSWPDGCGGTLNCNNGILDNGEVDVDCGNITGCKCGTGKICTGDADCSGNACRDGFCCNNNCTNTCRACAQVLTGQPNGTCANTLPGLQDTNCTGAFACNGQNMNPCVMKPANGAMCSGNSDCASNVCTDNVCCNTACTGTCMACLTAQTGLSVNVCGPVLKDIDPQNDCGSNDCCNGAGACYDGPINCN